MRKVITYGTFDLLHYGHVNLLRRAKELGDYLIVGVTSSDFDVNRGKINVKQSLMERIDAVKSTGLADEVIPEEYVGQKIDDIRNYDVDIFAIGSDWEGYFDYLNEYCQVVYLDRTKGVSSTQLRSEGHHLQLGIAGSTRDIGKFISEARYVSGVDICGLYPAQDSFDLKHDDIRVDSLQELIEMSDAIYVANNPLCRYEIAREALSAGKHVLCESPIAMTELQAQELFAIAAEKGLVFHEAIKTAYALAFSRLILLVKSGRIGKVTSIKSTCTSMAHPNAIGSLISWGPIACLPIFKLLGTDYKDVRAILRQSKNNPVDAYAKIDFVYEGACASFEVGTEVKSEGDLVIAGTKGYVYVPSPWWKTDYFELRYEDFSENNRFFYQLAGEGLRNEIGVFVRAIQDGRKPNLDIAPEHSIAFSKLIDECLNSKIDVFHIR